MDLHPERIVPDETAPGVVEHHLAKYRFALRQGLAPPVLDAASGVGYATSFVASSISATTVGVDLSPDAISIAGANYKEQGPAYFTRSDVTKLPFTDDAFGSVVGFETIEHIGDQDGYLAEIRRVLRAGGPFVCSTPYTAVTDTSPANPFHVLELNPQDFEALLRSHFDDVELYSQVRLDSGRARVLRRLDFLGLRRRVPAQVLALAGRASGTPPTALREAADFAVVPGIENATEVLAVCR